MEQTQTSYHGTTGKHLFNFLEYKLLFPFVAQRLGDGAVRSPLRFEREDNLGWGIRGSTQAVYVSDSYAIAWALWRKRNPESFILLEVELPDWISKEPVVKGNRDNRIPDPTTFVLQHIPLARFEDLELRPPDMTYAPPIYSCSWQDTYRATRSFGVYCENKGLPIKRLLFFERANVSHKDLLAWHRIAPDIGMPKEALDELHLFHRRLFDEPPNGAELFNF